MKPVGVFHVFPRPPIKTLFKDRYFVNGSEIGSGSGIAKLFKDPALLKNYPANKLKINFQES